MIRDKSREIGKMLAVGAVMLFAFAGVKSKIDDRVPNRHAIVQNYDRIAHLLSPIQTALEHGNTKSALSLIRSLRNSLNVEGIDPQIDGAIECLDWYEKMVIDIERVEARIDVKIDNINKLLQTWKEGKVNHSAELGPIIVNQVEACRSEVEKLYNRNYAENKKHRNEALFKNFNKIIAEMLEELSNLILGYTKTLESIQNSSGSTSKKSPSWVAGKLNEKKLLIDTVAREIPK